MMEQHYEEQLQKLLKAEKKALAKWCVFPDRDSCAIFVQHCTDYNPTRFQTHEQAYFYVLGIVRGQAKGV